MHGLKYIAFYVQKHITPRTVYCSFLLVRDKPLGAPASVKRVFLAQSTAGILQYKILKRQFSFNNIEVDSFDTKK